MSKEWFSVDCLLGVFLLVLAVVAPVAGALFVLSAVAVVEAQVSSVVLQMVAWLLVVQSL